MAMNCPKCGRPAPDNVTYCATCGSLLGIAYEQAGQVAQQMAKERSKRLPEWAIICIVLVIIALVLIPILVYSMPWSKIKVIVEHSEYSTIGVEVYIDGILKASVGVDPGTSIVGVWAVAPGTHTVQIDAGDWYYDPGGWFTDPYYYYVDSDGYADLTYAYEVGPLSTKNVWITLS